MGDRIKVCVRVRPLNSTESNRGDYEFWECNDENSTELVEAGGSSAYQSRAWHFDKVFGPSTSTAYVHSETVGKLVDPVINGIHGTALVYGQTSSGKTHTMFGSGDSRSSENLGSVQLAMQTLFELIEKKSKSRSFSVHMSYVEVYNEVIGDLLVKPNYGLGSASKLTPRFGGGTPVGGSRSTPVSVRDVPNTGGVTMTATRKLVQNTEEALAILAQAERYRHTACTNMNQRSSRAHTIVTLYVNSTSKIDSSQLTSQMNLVDLAGSESMRTSNACGEQVQEAKNINQSLLALAMVISSLAEGKESKRHIGFRNSKLTRILKPALCGKSMVTIICCITPSSRFQDETRNTLQFARTARKIPVQAKANRTIAPEVIIEQLRRELSELKAHQHDSRYSFGDVPKFSCETPSSARVSPTHRTPRREDVENKIAELQAYAERQEKQIKGLTKLLLEQGKPAVDNSSGKPAKAGFFTPPFTRSTSCNIWDEQKVEHHRSAEFIKLHQNILREQLIAAKADLRKQQEELSTAQGMLFDCLTEKELVEDELEFLSQQSERQLMSLEDENGSLRYVVNAQSNKVVELTKEKELLYESLQESLEDCEPIEDEEIVTADVICRLTFQRAAFEAALLARRTPKSRHRASWREKTPPPVNTKAERTRLCSPPNSLGGFATPKSCHSENSFVSAQEEHTDQMVESPASVSSYHSFMPTPKALPRQPLVRRCLTRNALQVPGYFSPMSSVVPTPKRFWQNSENIMDDANISELERLEHELGLPKLTSRILKTPLKDL